MIIIIDWMLLELGMVDTLLFLIEEALVVADENNPDLVVLDWMLPKAPGIEVCRRLRARGYTIRYQPRAEVVHAVGGSSGGAARQATIRAFHESAYRYYRTHVARDPVRRSLAWLLLHLRAHYKRRIG